MALPRTVPAQSVRESGSAGVRIVENEYRPNLTAPRYRVDTTPFLVIDGRSEGRNQSLGDVRGALRFLDGGIAIVEGDRYRVTFADSTGRIRFRIGTPGDGTSAGQFNYISGAFRLPHDQIGIWDGATDRLTGLNRDGRVTVWSRFERPQAEQLPIGVNHPRLEVLGRLADGRFLGQIVETVINGMASRSFVDSMPLVIIDRQGRASALTTVFKRRWFNYRGNPYAVVEDVPFAPVGAIAADGDGWYYSGGSRFEIEQHTPSGRVAAIMRLSRPRIALTNDAIKRFVDRRLVRLESKLRPDYAAAYAWVKHPAYSGAYTMLRVDRLGDVWARLWADDGDPATWDVFSPAGHWIGPVTVPPDLDIFDIGSNYLLASHVAAHGSQEVREYRLSRK
ncbi:MAG: hypothetical protein ACREL5_12715 [Gemmatimonadales bacterium]